jgi:hypothetical protein
MIDPQTLIETIVSGILSGGGSAVTAFVAVFRDIKKRLKTLEDSVGNDGSDSKPKTGLYDIVDRLNDNTHKLKKEIEAWQEDAPEWLIRQINRASRSSSLNLEGHAELERIMDQRFRSAAMNLQRVEERLDALQKSSNYVTQLDYARDNLKFVRDVATVKEQLATVNGLLRGIMVNMGYLDPPAEPKVETEFDTTILDPKSRHGRG